MKATRLALLLIVGAALLATSATAADYRLTLVTPLPSVTGSLTFNSLAGSPVTETAYIGPVWLNVYDVAKQQSLGTQRMICVDLFSTIRLNQTWDAVLATGRPDGVISNDAWDTITWMVQKNSGWAQGGWPTGSQAVQDAAIQTAVWEVSRDGLSFDLSSGAFKLNSTSGATRADVVAAAQGFFSSANPPAGYALDRQWYAACGTGQDMVFFVPETQTEVVPEIPAPVLGALGVTALGAIRRRFAGAR